MFKKILEILHIRRDLEEAVTQGVEDGFDTFSKTWNETEGKTTSNIVLTAHATRVIFETPTCTVGEVSTTISGVAIIEMLDDDFRLNSVTVGELTLSVATALDVSSEVIAISIIIAQGTAEIITLITTTNDTEIFMIDA